MTITDRRLGLQINTQETVPKPSLGGSGSSVGVGYNRATLVSDGHRWWLW